jgi:hypothetical protein
MVAALLAAVLAPAIGQAAMRQLLVFYSLPLVAGLFLYQGPLLALATRRRYRRVLLERLQTVLVSTNMVLAGLLANSAPLVKAHLNYCGWSTWTVLPWWTINVLGASGGGLLLYAYHAWAIRRGFAAWSMPLLDTSLAGGVMAVSSPPWRCLWLWIVLSFVALTTGIVLGAIDSTLVAGVP